jgi:hypothetical protein
MPEHIITRLGCLLLTSAALGDGQILLSPQPAQDDHFGVSMSGIGSRLAISAIWEDTAAGTDCGSVFCYERTPGGLWTLTQTLVAPVSADYDYFGSTLDMASMRLVATSYRADVNGEEDQGAADTFEWNGKQWQHAQRLLASDGAAYAFFGSSAALDGDTLAVTARYDDIGVQVAQGSAYIFRRNASGIWQQVQKLIDPTGTAADVFGFDVALQGDTLFVGAIWDDVGTHVDQGSVCVYRRQADGSFSFLQRLVAPDGVAHGEFGTRVHAVGNYVFCGSPNAVVDGTFGCGAVYSYRRGPDGTFVYAGKLQVADVELSGGMAASIDEEAGVIAVGAFNAMVDGVPGAGAVHLFRRDLIGEWLDVGTLVGSAPAGSGVSILSLGTSVSIVGDSLVTGSYLSTVKGQSAAGSAHAFTVAAATDLTLDGLVNGQDLAALLGVMGSTEPTGADIDFSGIVDSADLTRLLANWGS